MNFKMLTDEQLAKLNTKRLLAVLKVARAVESSEQRSRASWHVCCEECNEWMLGPKEYEQIVLKPTKYLTVYKNKIKEILATRENVL